MQNDLITAIIPVYNMGSFLSDAVDSIISQSYKNFELIIVDDGSTDNTKRVAGKYLKGGKQFDTRVSFISLDRNRGKLAALNKGISIGNGAFFTFIDADDTLPADSFQERITILQNNPSALLIYGDARYINAEGKFYRARKSRQVNNISELLDSFRTPVIGPTIMMRKKMLEIIGPFDTSYLRSTDLYIITEQFLPERFLYLPKSIYNYRTYKRNDIIKPRVRQWYDFVRIIIKHTKGFHACFLILKQTLFFKLKILFELFSSRK